MRDRTAGGSSCRERERERGLAIVEFVLVVPFLLVLLVGIIDFGFLFNDIISVRQGARDGGRQAAVGRFGPSSSCPDLAPEYNVSGSAAALICLTKSLDDVPDRETRVRVMVGEVGCETTSSCYEVGKPITICEQYKTRSLTGMLTVLNGRVQTTRTVFRVETVSGSGLSTAWEVPFKPWSCPAPSEP